MKGNIINISAILASIFLTFTSCGKDDEMTPESPLNGKTTAVFNNSLSYGTMTDQDGNIYKTITIGSQTWMAENLRTTTYNDGTPIPNITDDIEWGSLSTGAYCNHSNTNDKTTIATYGRLYNWYAVNTGKLAPDGWHVPSDAEWTTLETYLGAGNAADKLKETGTLHWLTTNNNITNESGFTALPGGYRHESSSFGRFEDKGNFGYWWSATAESNSGGSGIWYRTMDYDSYVSYGSHLKEVGFSVRCVMD